MIADDINPTRRRLDSWKAIALHLGRTVRTVQRWEREQGLPVHRLSHNKQSSIYAFTDELDAWMAGRTPDAEQPLNEGSVRAHTVPATTEHKVRPPKTRVISALAAVLAIAVVAPLLGKGVLIDRLRAAQSASDVDRGRRAWNERTAHGFERARLAFERAIALNPQNARAYSGLADTYSLLEAFGLMDRVAALRQARAAATAAVARGPALAEPHTSLGFVLWEEGHRAEAFAELDAAIKADPQYATAHHWRALFLQDSGRFEDAVAECRVASALDPQSPVIAADLGVTLRYAGRLDESHTVLQDTVSRHPSFAGGHVELAETYRLMGDHQRALRSLRTAVKLGDDRPTILARLAAMEGRLGNRGAAFDIARRLRAIQDRGQLVPDDAWLTALVAAGDYDAAAAFVDRLIAAGEVAVTRIATDDAFEGLRRSAQWPRLRGAIERFARERPPVAVAPALQQP